MTRRHSHYFKDVRGINSIDVYRVLQLFNVTDPCIQHAVKKLLVAGGRGAGKDITRDIKEAIDSLERWQEMRAEEAAALLLTEAEQDEGEAAWEVGSAFKRVADGIRAAFNPVPSMDETVSALRAAGVPERPFQGVAIDDTSNAS